jgi:hypothetical protein
VLRKHLTLFSITEDPDATNAATFFIRKLSHSSLCDANSSCSLFPIPAHFLYVPRRHASSIVLVTAIPLLSVPLIPCSCTPPPHDIFLTPYRSHLLLLPISFHYAFIFTPPSLNFCADAARPYLPTFWLLFRHTLSYSVSSTTLVSSAYPLPRFYFVANPSVRATFLFPFPHAHVFPLSCSISHSDAARLQSMFPTHSPAIAVVSSPVFSRRNSWALVHLYILSLYSTYSTPYFPSRSVLTSILTPKLTILLPQYIGNPTLHILIPINLFFS